VVEAIRAPNGRIFNSSIPDWYSGFAIVSRIERLGVSGIPLHICGTSPKSNGYAGYSGNKNDVLLEFTNLSVQQGLPWHPGIPELIMSPSCLSAECLEQVRDHLPLDPSIVISPKQLLRSTRVDLLSCGWPIAAEAWASHVKEITRYADRHGLGDWLQVAFPEIYGSAPEWKPQKQLGYGLTKTHLNLSAARFGVSDVNGAGQLMAQMLQGGSGDMSVVAEPSSFSKWTSATKDLVKSGLPVGLLEMLSGLKASADELKLSLRDRARGRTGGS
jgi:hypothetical protein